MGEKKKRKYPKKKGKNIVEEGTPDRANYQKIIKVIESTEYPIGEEPEI